MDARVPCSCLLDFPDVMANPFQTPKNSQPLCGTYRWFFGISLLFLCEPVLIVWQPVVFYALPCTCRGAFQINFLVCEKDFHPLRGILADGCAQLVFRPDRMCTTSAPTKKRARIGEKKSLTSLRFIDFGELSCVLGYSGKLIIFIYPFPSTGADGI
jgi:hypothetical protein